MWFQLLHRFTQSVAGNQTTRGGQSSSRRRLNKSFYFKDEGAVKTDDFGIHFETFTDAVKCKGKCDGGVVVVVLN